MISGQFRSWSGRENRGVRFDHSALTENERIAGVLKIFPKGIYHFLNEAHAANNLESFVETAFADLVMFDGAPEVLENVIKIAKSKFFRSLRLILINYRVQPRSCGILSKACQSWSFQGDQHNQLWNGCAEWIDYSLSGLQRLQLLS
jgi:hypothetical protein